VKLGGGDVLMPAGLYLARGIRLYSNIRLLGDGRDKTILREATGVSYLVSVNPGSAGSVDPSQNEHDIEIANIAFEGPVLYLGFAEHQHLLNFNGVTRLDVHECAIRGFRGDGIYLGSGNVGGLERHNIAVRFLRNEFDGINADNRNGISVIDGTGVLISENRFIRCSRRTMPGPIDIEPNGHPFQRIADIAIEGNRFDDCGGNVAKIAIHVPVVGAVSQPIRGIRIAGNTIGRNQRSGNGLYIRVVDARGRGNSASCASASAIQVSDNVIENGSSLVQGVNDFVIERNRFTGANSSLIVGGTESQQTGYAKRGRITFNTFEDQDGKDGALTIGRAVGLAITTNKFIGKPGNLGPAIVFAASRQQPLCEGVTLEANSFSDNYALHVWSPALATSNRVRILESNRTFNGKTIATSGIR
jgi:hypothetical protein